MCNLKLEKEVKKEIPRQKRIGEIWRLEKQKHELQRDREESERDCFGNSNKLSQQSKGYYLPTEAK